MSNGNNEVVSKDAILTIVEAQPGSGAKFDVIFHKELLDLGLALDLGEYFTSLVRNQVIRTREPEPEEEPEDGSEI